MASEFNIDSRLTTAIGTKVNLYRDIAETDTTPYAVYALEYETKYTQDGPYKYVADVSFAVVATTAEERDLISKSCHDAIQLMQSNDLRVVHVSTKPDSDGNIEFVSVSTYRITQIINN